MFNHQQVAFQSIHRYQNSSVEIHQRVHTHAVPVLSVALLLQKGNLVLVVIKLVKMQGMADAN